MKHLLWSTCGLKPSSSTDKNTTKTAIRTKLEPLSLSSEIEKSPRLPLLASVAPELLLLTLLSPWFPAQVFFAGSTGLPPDPQGRGRRVNHVQRPAQLVTTGQGYLLAGPHSVMRKIKMVTTPPCCCFGWVPTW